MTAKSAVLVAAAILVAASSIHASSAQFPFSVSSEPILSHTNLTGQSVYRFSVTSRQQHNLFLRYTEEHNLDVWSAKRGHSCQDYPSSAISPDWNTEAGCITVRMLQSNKDHLLSQIHLSHPTTLIQDLQATVMEQERQKIQRKSRIKSLSFDQSWHDDYRSYDEISHFLTNLQQTYPQYAKKMEIGKTHEGRSIFALKVGKSQVQDPVPPGDGDDNPNGLQAEKKRKGRKGKKGGNGEKIGIVIAAEQHAREWISASTSLFFASELLRSALGNPETNRTTMQTEDDLQLPWTKKEAKAILKSFDLTFIPLSNPDGYVYSWEQSRMWRKNRQPTKFPGICKGVDLNRNWGFHFESALNPCSESFAGSKAFDALETQAIAAYMNDTANNIQGYFDLHSYGQLLMYPFSFSCYEPVGDEEDLLELSLGAVRALRDVHKRTYTTGKMCQVLAELGGSSIDWTYSNHIKWSFSIQLRDGGTYGFLLPPSQIIATGQETSQALIYMLKFIQQKQG